MLVKGFISKSGNEHIVPNSYDLLISLRTHFAQYHPDVLEALLEFSKKTPFKYTVVQYGYIIVENGFIYCTKNTPLEDIEEYIEAGYHPIYC